MGVPVVVVVVIATLWVSRLFARGARVALCGCRNCPCCDVLGPWSDRFTWIEEPGLYHCSTDAETSGTREIHSAIHSNIVLRNIRLMKTKQRFLCAALAAVLATVAESGRAEDFDAARPCAPASEVQELGIAAQELTIKTDQLVQGLTEDHAPSITIYLLTRQMAIIERTHRRLLESGEFCDAAIEGLGRDVAMLQQIYKRFAEGNAALKTEKLKSQDAQIRIRELVVLMDKYHEKLRPLLNGGKQNAD